MTKRILFSTIGILFSLAVMAQKGYNIRVKLDNYPFKELIIGFHFGEKQYVKDTAILGNDGYFTFKADTLFQPGVYLLVLKPDNKPVEMMMPADDQDFTLTTDATEPSLKMKVKGSDDNEAFYEYLKYLAAQRPEADSMRAQMSRAKTKADSAVVTTKLTEIDTRVKKFQRTFIDKHPEYVGAKIVRASIDPEAPDFKGDDVEMQRKRYYWYRAHYFDNINLSDPVLLRSPVLHSKLDYYVNKLLPQHPDSLNVGIDYIFDKMKGSPETQKYYISHFLNFFAKSQLVGFDACYVHIGEKYFCTATCQIKKTSKKFVIMCRGSSRY